MRIGIDVGILREKARGVGFYLINLLDKFSQITNEDSFYLYSPRPVLYNFIKGQNWYNRFGTIPLPGSFWLQTQGKQFIKKDKVDIFFGPAHVLPIKLSKNIKTVLAVHDLVSVYYPDTMANYNRFIHNLFFKSSIKSADHIITMSEYTKQSIIDYFSISPDKITVIYEGVRQKFRPYQKDEILSIVAQYQIKNPYILSVGTFEPRKNYILLLKAFERLKGNFDLVIIGKKGWKSQEIFDTINALKLNDRVKILGYVDDNDMPYLYNGAAFFVFPSVYEGFGLPVLEAMACGAPVICSKSSSLPEIGGEAVLYFESNLQDDLTRKMQRLLADEQLKSLLREKGIVQAKKFNWGATARKTLSILKSI